MHERLSFADYFYQQHMEEVDLSQYAGRDIYIAFRCCSDKMQGDLWLWDMMVTDKLATPKITKFERNADGGLHVEKARLAHRAITRLTICTSERRPTR